MDTTNTILADTSLAAVANQAFGEAKDPNSFAIFVMGVAGVFTFVLLYIVITKLSAIIIRKLNKNKLEKGKE